MDAWVLWLGRDVRWKRYTQGDRLEGVGEGNGEHVNGEWICWQARAVRQGGRMRNGGTGRGSEDDVERQEG